MLLLLLCFLLSHTTAFFSSDPSGGGKSWTAGTSGVAMTGNQRLALHQIRECDAEFDQDLDEIDLGVQDLHELALRQGEEGRRQNQMLNEVGSKIEKEHELMGKVDEKMNDTLIKVGRSWDKLCVDIICIVIFVCLVAVIYKTVRSG